jgi:hypothetical protein
VTPGRRRRVDNIPEGQPAIVGVNIRTLRQRKGWSQAKPGELMGWQVPPPWKGPEEHALAGWNSGPAPYGYLAQRVPHPVPAKAAQGLTKSRLIPDPARAGAVTQIFCWRVTGRLSIATIVARLNADPAAYPPPAKGGWIKPTVNALLANPKYTGYMVYGRTRTTNGRKGRPAPQDQWIWSPEPVHPALIDRATWHAAQTIGGQRGNVRDPEMPKGAEFCDSFRRVSDGASGVYPLRATLPLTTPAVDKPRQLPPRPYPPPHPPASSKPRTGGPAGPPPLPVGALGHGHVEHRVLRGDALELGPVRCGRVSRCADLEDCQAEMQAEPEQVRSLRLTYSVLSTSAETSSAAAASEKIPRVVVRPSSCKSCRRCAVVADAAAPTPVDHDRGTEQDYERDQKVQPEHHRLLSGGPLRVCLPSGSA